MTPAPSPAQSAGRDHRVDFWRGIALAMIFVNHVPGNLWEDYTSRNFGFSDSAELFVFLAGFASAFAYARPFLAGDRLRVTVKAWRRAGVLYLVHATLTLAAIAILCWGALVLGNGSLLETIGMRQFIEQPLEAMVGFAILGHQLGYVNILPMYSAILLMLPAILALSRLGKGVMLAASGTLWLLAYAFGLNIPAYPLPGGWFFDPFSWQFLFTIGLYCGLCRLEGVSPLPHRPWIMALALAFCFAAFLTARYELFDRWTAIPLPTLLVGFDKTYVSVPRLLHVLALVYIFAHPARRSPLRRISAGNVFTMMGRHSLPVFATGTVLSLLGQVAKFGEGPNLVFDTLLVAVGIGLQVALAAWLDWWRQNGKRRPKGTPAPAPVSLPVGERAPYGTQAAPRQA